MVAAASQAGRIYAVSQNYRYDRHIRRLKGLLPQLGPLTLAHMDFFMGPHFGGFRDRMAHPLLLDMAIHHFDAARFLLGADPVAVYCRAWNPRGSWYDGAATAVCTFEMSDGIVYTYRGSWCSEGLPTSWNGEWRIVGERGTATWTGDDVSRAAVVTGEGGFFSEVKPLTPPPDEAGSEDLGAVLAGFIRSVETGVSPETVCTDNIKSLAMVFGAIESARTGMRELIET
jgi:predicted dehydrogenase